MTKPIALLPEASDLWHSPADKQREKERSGWLREVVLLWHQHTQVLESWRVFNATYKFCNDQIRNRLLGRLTRWERRRLARRKGRGLLARRIWSRP